MSGFIRPRSITGELLVAILAVFLLAMAYQYAAFHQSYRSREALARAFRASVAHSAAAAADDALKDAMTELRNAWASPGNRNHRDETIKSLLSVHPEWVGTSLIDTGSASPVRPAPKPADPAAKFLAGPQLVTEPTVSAVIPDPDRPRFVVSIPVSAPGKGSVIAYAVVANDAVKREVENAVGKEARIHIIDGSGTTVCRVGLPEEARTNQSSEVHAAGQSDETREAKAQLRNADWQVVVADDGFIPKQSSLEWLPRALITSLLAALLALCMGKRIASPIRKLSRAAAAVAVGDLRRRVTINTGDELQSLAESFNRMAENLEAHEQELRTKTRVQQTLFELAGTITSSLDLCRVATSISDALKQHFHATEVVVFGLNDITGKLEPIPLKNGENPASESLARLAAHALSAPGALSVPAAVAYPFSTDDSTAVALPLKVGDERVGVLAARLTPGESWDIELRNKLELMETFASWAAVALHNAHIHGRTEDFIRMLDSLRRVTEAISSSLDLKQVLRTLVRTTAEVMHAKACAIMLLDGSGQLAAAEAHNLSSDFREKLSMAPGEPWTGVAFSEMRTILREDLLEDSDLRLSDEIEREGLRGLICSPLIVANEAIGTINVWTAEPYQGRRLEVYLLSSIASHAAAVIANAKLFGREYQIAETLQDTLKAEVPERIGNLTFGHKYMPALDEASVGGDLYDVVSLPGGKVALIVADVAGKGIQAAVHTAMIRYTLRSFIYKWPDSPAKALEYLNRASMNYSSSKVLVTVFCAVIDSETGVMVYANGGHPPAIVITNEGKRLVHLYRTGMPVGACEDCAYEDRKIRLEQGSSLLLYTDGVIEAGRQGELLAIEGLESILFENSGLGPMEMVETVCRETIEYAECDLKDDIALVAAGFGR